MKKRKFVLTPILVTVALLVVAASTLNWCARTYDRDCAARPAGKACP